MPSDPDVTTVRGCARSSRMVMIGLTARTATRSGLAWGAVFAITIASSAVSYTALYTTPMQRHALAVAYGSNRATSALFGPAPRLETVAGFTAFKVSMALMILGAVWGLLISTRLLRGEEDAGRWEILLSGQTTAPLATAQTLLGIGTGLVVMLVLTAVGTLLAGRGAHSFFGVVPSLYFALAMVATAIVFTGIGAVTSQLAATRRQAVGYGATALGVAYAVRMVADAGVGLHSLIWVSPLGWVEELGALTAPHPAVLACIVMLAAALVSCAVGLSGGRDLGAGLVPDRTAALPRLRLLRGPASLAIRLTRPTVLAWWAAITVSGLLYGLIAKSAGATISGSSVHEVLSRLGASGSGAAAVLGVCFLVLAVLIAFVAAGQLTAARSEESSGRLDNLLARPVSTTRWLGGRLILAVSVLLVGGALGGLAAWVGAASQHASLPITTLLIAGVNLVPPALVVLGLGVLTLGFAPRITSIVVYGYLTWSLLVLVVGGIGATSHWVLDTSVFHQMAAAPAVPVDWWANATMVLVAVVSAGVGLAGLKHRDLAGD